MFLIFYCSLPFLIVRWSKQRVLKDDPKRLSFSLIQCTTWFFNFQFGIVTIYKFTREEGLIFFIKLLLLEKTKSEDILLLRTRKEFSSTTIITPSPVSCVLTPYLLRVVPDNDILFVVSEVRTWIHTHKSPIDGPSIFWIRKVLKSGFTNFVLSFLNCVLLTSSSLYW